MPLFSQKGTEETRIGQKLGCVIVDPTCQLPEAFLTACNIDLDRRQWPSSLNLVDLPKLDCSFSAYELLPFILQAFIVGDTAMFSKLILVIHRNPYMLNYLQKVFDFPGLEMNFLRARCATLLRDIDDTSADDGVEKIVKKTLVHCKMWSARLLNKSRAVWWFACVILFPFLEHENAQELHAYPESLCNNVIAW